MNSKERVQAALCREPVDKIPLGFYVVDHDTIEKVIGRPTVVRNRVEIQLALWEGRRDELVETWIADIIEFYEKLDCVDLLSVKDAPTMPPRGYEHPDPPKPIGDNLYRDSKGVVWKAAPESNSLKIVERPPREEEIFTVESFSDHTPPPEPEPSCFEIMNALVARFKDERFILSGPGGFSVLTLGAGFEKGLIMMASEPDVAKALISRNTARDNFLDQFYIRPGTDGVIVEEDMGGSDAPFISPRMFRNISFPYLVERIANIKKYVPFIVMHNCGNNLPLMEMFLEAGIDAYESIQSNTDMSIATLRDRFGDRLTIWGAVSLDILDMGTPDDVKAEVRRCMEEGRKAPGFILGPSHSIAFGTKYENFMAMLDEFDKLR